MIDNYTITNVVEEYLLERQIAAKKWLPAYLVYGRNAWKELFKNTIYTVISVWQPLKQGKPYSYIEIPSDVQRLLAVSMVDHCGNQKPLFYNEKMNTIPKPTKKKCGCNDSKCDCGDLCNDVNSTVYTTQLLFTINGVDYYEKIWMTLCPNGDILEYRETPAKKYNSLTGDGADFNDDFNNDFDIAPPFTDYSIVYQKTHKKICSISVKPCGCPVQTEENEKIFYDTCGTFLPYHLRQKCLDGNSCNAESGVYTGGNLGTIKISDCGTKIFFKPDKRHKCPDFLLLNYQTKGENCNTEVLIPDYAVDCLKYGIDFMYKRFSGKYGRGEVNEAKYAFRDARAKLTIYINPIQAEWLTNIQQANIKF